jgi:hypothetical protein
LRQYRQGVKLAGVVAGWVWRAELDRFVGDHHDSVEWLRDYCIARVYPYLDMVDDSNTELCALLWVLNKGFGCASLWAYLCKG